MVSMMDILSGAVRLVVDVRQTMPTPQLTSTVVGGLQPRSYPSILQII